MDTLIVLRKPLRKTKLEPKFIVPKKSKKALPKTDPIPPSPNLGLDSNEPLISFVKLYKDLCVEISRRANTRVHMKSPTRVRMNEDQAPQCDKGPAAQMRVRSDTSLVTQYRGRCVTYTHDIACREPPPSRTRAELILELDYDTSFKDSEYC